jgi:hypothetical protein
MWRFEYKLLCVTHDGRRYEETMTSQQRYTSEIECYRDVNRWNMQHCKPYWYHYVLLKAWRE